MNRSLSIAALVLALASESNAGDLVIGGTITKVANTSDNGTSFSILVTGGTSSLCSSWITFPLSAAADADTHKRAYAAALLALSTATPVRVHNYLGNNCNTASYLEVG